MGLLATGGMAEVFLARQSGPGGFERPVVIKRVLPHLVRETVFHDMFLDEARLVVRIHHPNVVHVHELGDERGELYLVMEYLEGESLSVLTKRLRATGQSVSDRGIVHILAEACAGLHAAHELSEGGESLGLVHRDVSPHNLFLLYTGQVKVIDFGIAKAADRTSRTETGAIKGKFTYMAPEQVRAEPLDRRTDVFALGVVLYELLTQTSLFSRDNELLVMQAICSDPIPDLRACRPDIDPELERIVMKALARSAEDRYATAAAMRRDLVALERRIAAEWLPEEELAAVMQDLFEARIAEKRDMLVRVEEGQAVTRVVGGDTERSASAPQLPTEIITGTVSPAQILSVAAPRVSSPRSWLLVAGAAVLVAVGVAVGLQLAKSSSNATSGVTASGDAASDMAPSSSPVARAADDSWEVVQQASVFGSAEAAGSSASAEAPLASNSLAGASPSAVTRPRPPLGSSRPVPIVGGPKSPAPKSKTTPGFGRFD